MKCPYCISEISDEALACPHCARDLYLFKPLLAKIEALEQKVCELEARATSAKPLPVSEEMPEPEPAPPATARERAFEIGLLWGTPLALLLFAHLMIAIVFDANVLWLRVVSLLIPLPFGFALMNRRWRPFAAWNLAAFAMATCAVLGMSWITSLVDHTAVLPQDFREWKEFAEYAASVGFSFMTGMLIGRMAWRHRQAAIRAEQVRGLVLRLAQMISAGHEGAEKIQGTVKKLKDMGNSLAAAGTTAAAAYTGLQGFLGS